MSLANPSSFTGITALTGDVTASGQGSVAATLGTTIGQVPVGSIVAWHKSFANTPALPSNWLECNGQVVSDAGSPYNGQTLPDLNGGTRFLRGSSTSGTLQAGTVESHSHAMDHNHLQDAHTHTQNSHNHTQDAHTHVQNSHVHGPSTTWGFNDTADSGVTRRPIFDFKPDDAADPITPTASVTAVNQSATATNQATTATNQNTTATNQAFSGSTSASGSSETRPINMSVVWIIRIK